jgi:hypothetical protein
MTDTYGRILGFLDQTEGTPTYFMEPEGTIKRESSSWKFLLIQHRLHRKHLQQFLVSMGMCAMV